MSESQEKQHYFVQKPANAYVIDAESTAEMGRLINQDRLVTAAMGGLFPADITVGAIQSVLDIGCGPGGWAQEVAFHHPEMQVTGIDISQSMIAYAQAQAQVQGLENVQFLVMDATKPLAFADAVFDFVNARFVNPFIRHMQIWPRLLGEMWRLTRAGGVIRVTEADDAGTSNSSAFERLKALAIEAGRRDGRPVPITPHLESFLQDIGCQSPQKQEIQLDFSAGSMSYPAMFRDYQVMMKLIQPYIVKLGAASQEELDTLYYQMLAEMMRDDFRGEWRFLSVWGRKP
jgi:ubiquinone/menaquinone biosynthesis C-methylase UbiE